MKMKNIAHKPVFQLTSFGSHWRRYQKRECANMLTRNSDDDVHQMMKHNTVNRRQDLRALYDSSNSHPEHVANTVRRFTHNGVINVKDHPDKFIHYYDYRFMAHNSDPAIMDILKKAWAYKQSINSTHWEFNWVVLSRNPCAVDLLEANPDRVDFVQLAMNPSPRAIALLTKLRRKYNWSSLSRNPYAMHLIEANLDKVDWRTLSSNPNAMHLIEANPDKVCWRFLSANPHPRAISMLERNVDKIDWKKLSANPSAIHLLKRHPDKVMYTIGSNPCAWYVMSNNVFMFKNAMKETCKPFAEELVAYVFRPERLLRLCDAYGMELVDYIELIEGER